MNAPPPTAFRLTATGPGRAGRARLLLPAAGWVGLLLGLSGLPVRAAEADPATLAELRERLQAHLTQPRFARAYWGVHIVSLDIGRTLFSANADKWFVPASTAKLFTGALALDVLDPDFRIRTSVLAPARPDVAGTLAGDLWLVGRGDPGFHVGEAGGDWDRALAPLLEAVTRAGVQQVLGGVVADASYFLGPPVGSGWEYDDLVWYYGAEVSALTLNNNALQVIARPGRAAGLPAEVFVYPSTPFLTVSNRLRTGPAGGTVRVELRRAPEANVVHARGTLPLDARPVSETVAVREPARWFGEEFRRALLRRGVRVRGPVRVWTGEKNGSGARPGVELGAGLSAPLRDLLPRMLKPSQNLHAQLWLLQAGRTLPPAVPEETSEEAGRRALEGFLRRAGIPAQEARFEEGSGLSRHNVVTPRALVRLLEYMSRHPHAAVFRDALPVAGVDGTLRGRLRGTPAEGNLRAKTGTLDLVHSLAGYVTTAAGERLAFALLLNQYAGAGRPGRAELDEVAAWLAGLRQSTREEAE